MRARNPASNTPLRKYATPTFPQRQSNLVISAEVVDPRANEHHAPNRQECDATRDDKARFRFSAHGNYCTTIVPTMRGWIVHA